MGFTFSFNLLMQTQRSYRLQDPLRLHYLPSSCYIRSWQSASGWENRFHVMTTLHKKHSSVIKLAKLLFFSMERALRQVLMDMKPAQQWGEDDWNICPTQVPVTQSLTGIKLRTHQLAAQHGTTGLTGPQPDWNFLPCMKFVTTLNFFSLFCPFIVGFAL